MISRRWVDVAVAAVVALGIGILVLGALSGRGAAGSAAERLPWGAAGLGLLVAAYVVARPSAGAEDARRFRAFLAIAFVGLAVMTFADPSLATMQVIAYPLVWIFAPARRDGVSGSVVVGVGMFVGYAGGFVFALDAVVEALAVAVLSVAFSIAMGWWITAIAEYGQERARLLAELSEAQQQVEALNRDRGASAEREHLAREIHDTLAQTLAGLVMLAEQAGRRSRGGDAEGAAEAAERLEAAAREALGEARAIVARTAAVPGDPALGAAVERLVERFRADTGLAIAVVDTLSTAAPAPAGAAGDETIGRETQVVVLRCMQEALANVRKHAGAARVDVGLARDDDGWLRLEVHDDGRGFDPGSPRTGYGLDGMRERVALAGGSVEVAATAGAGTTLTVRLPAAAALASGREALPA
ncbi:sensor histidine kinase [Microbacterium sp. cf332]|uniref:sensor histidine kinase n=1 Tax=Microbacterium sp. cf332 TaxID=1761804 RepID=UPI0008844A6F|nr:ATP-binding protein [Microbacterium sp. cf332]SDQ25025.1 Signal transduction histidine kinase [Microbacterium sp. cf332]